MIDLSKVGSKALPGSIDVLGRVFSIHTDYQYFIAFSQMVKEDHNINDYDFLYNGPIPEEKQIALEKLLQFAFPVQELPRNLEEEKGPELINYCKDSNLIYAAFLHYYNIDLLDDNLHLHWYKFLALLSAIKDTKLNDVMGIRGYTPGKNDSKEYHQTMTKLKDQWKLEEDITDDEEALIAEFDRINNINN